MILASSLLAAISTPASAPAQAAPVVGDWGGTLQVSGVQLRIVFHIRDAPSGGLTATMDSPDQGAFGIAVTAVEADGDSVVLRVDPINGVYRRPTTPGPSGPRSRPRRFPTTWRT
jgi:hypothetical protein